MMTRDWHLDVERDGDGHWLLIIFEPARANLWTCPLDDCSVAAIFEALRDQLFRPAVRPIPASRVRIVTDNARHWSGLGSALGIEQHFAPPGEPTIFEIIAQKLIDNSNLDSSADETPGEANANADTTAVQNMIVWASGMVEFIGDRPEPDGAILICTAHGRAAIDALLGGVDESCALHDFGGRIAKRVPGIHPDDPAPDVHELIYWGDDLRNDLGARADIRWVRQ